jgi:CRP-like cAMP-binding protein
VNEILDNYHLKSNSFFDLLNNDEASYVKSKIVRKEFLKGEFLFKEKSYSKGIYIVKKGKIKIFQTNIEGKDSIVYIYKKGDYFGYRPILSADPHPVSAVAIDNSVVSFLPRENFLSLIRKSPSLSANLLSNLSKEFSVWINKMTIFSQYGVKERVALSLLILMRVYARDESDYKNAVIRLNRDDFASFVGTAKETLVRTLRVFKDEKFITARGTQIYVLKPKALMNIVIKA